MALEFGPGSVVSPRSESRKLMVDHEKNASFVGTPGRGGSAG
jgi:hypothetical protein